MNKDMSFSAFATLKYDKKQVTVNISREDTNVSAVYQLELLKLGESMFLPCNKTDVDDNQIKLVYSKDSRFHEFHRIKEKTIVEKLNILLRISNYFDVKRNYSTCFSPDNIFFSNDYEVVFAYRNIENLLPPYNYGKQRETEDFKALILSVLQDKYSYYDLLEMGIDILEKDKLFADIISAQTVDDIKLVLQREYDKAYMASDKEKVAFKKTTLRLAVIGFSVAFLISFSAMIYFAYRNVFETNKYSALSDAYEYYLLKSPQKVVAAAERLRDKERSDVLKIVMADSYIALGDEDSLIKAFYLDSNRQLEVVELLVKGNKTSVVATLRSDKPKVQLYQAYYGNDYNKAISLAKGNRELINDAQAQVILAQSYAKQKNFQDAEMTAKDLKDDDLLLDILKQHKEYISSNETNIELREEGITKINQLIKTLESRQNDV